MMENKEENQKEEKETQHAVMGSHFLWFIQGGQHCVKQLARMIDLHLQLIIMSSTLQ